MFPAMSDAKSPPQPAPQPHATFFRQSGWLMIASIGGGMVFYLVHLLSKKITEAEYGAFGVMLAVAMCVPNMPLQMVFAQQTAKAQLNGRERALAGMIRLALLGTLAVVLLLAVGVGLWQTQIMAAWKLPSLAGLWMTVLVVLLSFWLPIFLGLMQGQQNFLWLGWDRYPARPGQAGGRRRAGPVFCGRLHGNDCRCLLRPGGGGGHWRLADAEPVDAPGGIV